MTINSSFLPKLLLHCRLHSPSLQTTSPFPLKLGSNLFPLSFIRSGWLINYLPRQVPFPFIIHSSCIHPFKDICWVYLPKSRPYDLYYYFKPSTPTWVHTPSLQMANCDPNKLVNLLDQVCTMLKLIPILLLYIGQKKATENNCNVLHLG